MYYTAGSGSGSGALPPPAAAAATEKGFPVAAVFFTCLLGFVLLVWLGLRCQRRFARLRPPSTKQFKTKKNGLDYHAKDAKLHKGAPTPLMSTVAEMRALARRSPANKHKKKQHR